MNAALMIGKAVTLAVWLWAIAGTLGVAVPAADLAPMVAGGLLVAHIVEIALLLPRLKRAGGSTAGHALSLLVFGMFHYRSVMVGSR